VDIVGTSIEVSLIKRKVLWFYQINVQNSVKTIF